MHTRSDGWEIWSRIRLAIVGLVLCLPIAIMSSPWLQAKIGSRAPAFPDWSWKVGDLKRYPSRFEVEFNLALPSRVEVASLARRVYIDWLRVSPVAEVVLGTDGWLYYTGPAGERLLDRHVRGRDPFSQESSTDGANSWSSGRDAFAASAPEYVFVIAPNKESIYPEHLPGWIGPRVGPTRLDQLMAHLKSATDVTVIDLRPALLAEKKASVVYYKADTHWNTRGAYAAYREIVRVLAPEFPALAAKSWDEPRPDADRAHGIRHGEDDRADSGDAGGGLRDRPRCVRSRPSRSDPDSRGLAVEADGAGAASSGATSPAMSTR